MYQINTKILQTEIQPDDHIPSTEMIQNNDILDQAENYNSKLH